VSEKPVNISSIISPEPVVDPMAIPVCSDDTIEGSSLDSSSASMAEIAAIIDIRPMVLRSFRLIRFRS